MLTPEKIIIKLNEIFFGLKTVEVYGETNLFYNPENIFKHGIYFATIKCKDGPSDKASQLNRDSIFRLNFCISKTTFQKIFGKIPPRPEKGCVINGGYNFLESNVLTPHPVYGWMCWVCILNPNQIEQVLELLSESYRLSINKYSTKIKLMNKFK